MSMDSSGILQGALGGGGGGGGTGLTSTSSMRNALLRCHLPADVGPTTLATTGATASSKISSSSASSMPPPTDLPPQTPSQQHQQELTASSIDPASATSSVERNSFKRTHRRDMSAGTKTTMLWLKASEEYAEERRRRADLPPCVSADDVVDDIFQEFDMVKKAGWDRGDVAENSGLKLSDVQ